MQSLQASQTQIVSPDKWTIWLHLEMWRPVQYQLEGRLIPRVA